jgi:tetratricopeptide (TPR) repeat protein
MGLLQSPGFDRPPTTRKRRLWSVAPGPPESAQAFEGYAILNDLPTAGGFMLFQWVRAVRLWSRVDPAGREGLFGGVSRPAYENADPTLVALAAPFDALFDAPHACTAHQLAAACTRVSEWATGASLLATAVEFAEAGAWARTDDPDLCFRAGRACRQAAAHPRAILWFQRGIGMARRSGAWTSYVDCWLGLGNLEIARGRFDAAHRFLVKALRAARKHNLRELLAAAHHDLFMLCGQLGRFGEASEHANAALELYPLDNPYYPHIIHDLAEMWRIQNWPSVALPLIAGVRRLLSGSALLQVNGNIAGAAGAMGDMDTFYAAWDAVSAAGVRASEYLASALISVSEGARALRLGRQALDVAMTAASVARQRGESLQEQRANALILSVRAGEPPPEAEEPPEHVRRMADLLLLRLQDRTEA